MNNQSTFTAVQRQKAVTAHLRSKQLLPFVVAVQCKTDSYAFSHKQVWMLCLQAELWN